MHGVWIAGGNGSLIPTELIHLAHSHWDLLMGQISSMHPHEALIVLLIGLV